LTGGTSLSVTAKRGAGVALGTPREYPTVIQVVEEKHIAITWWGLVLSLLSMAHLDGSVVMERKIMIVQAQMW
jgi:hypothetical protein